MALKVRLFDEIVEKQRGEGPKGNQKGARKARGGPKPHGPNSPVPAIMSAVQSGAKGVNQ